MYPLDFVSIMSERMTGAYDTSMVTVHPYTLQVPLPTLIGDTEYQLCKRVYKRSVKDIASGYGDVACIDDGHYTIGANSDA